MSTNARIACMLPNGNIYETFIHYDGYKSHTGEMLIKHYKTLQKVYDLIMKGSMPSLQPEIEEIDFYIKHNVHKEIISYHNEGIYDSNINSINNKVQFNYLFKNREWYLNGEKISNNVNDTTLVTDKIIKKNTSIKSIRAYENCKEIDKTIEIENIVQENEIIIIISISNIETSSFTSYTFKKEDISKFLKGLL